VGIAAREPSPGPSEDTTAIQIGYTFGAYLTKGGSECVTAGKWKPTTWIA
jgi:hypothetical protein